MSIDNYNLWCIWVMKEYGVLESWTNICEMSTTQIFDEPIRVRVITYRSSREGGEVLLSMTGSKLVWYNLKSKFF